MTTVCSLLLLVVQGFALAGLKYGAFGIRQQLNTEKSDQVGAAPTRNLEGSGIGSSRMEVASNNPRDDIIKFEGGKDGHRRVSVSTVSWITLVMAAETGFGKVHFLFVELGAQWDGICNGIATRRSCWKQSLTLFKKVRNTVVEVGL